jgi:hypothetical protein
MRRSCERPTCSFPATASVLIELDIQRAELVNLADPPLGHHHLCGRHAASTSVPLGWTLVDSRSPEIALWTELPEQQVGADVRVLHPTPVRTEVPADVPLEPLPFGTTVEPGAAVATATEVASSDEPAEVFARHADLEGSEALAAALAAATPLLSRAFSEVQAS